MYYYKHFITIVFLMLLQQACTQDISAHRWQNRLVIILTDQPTNSAYLEQLQELQQDQEALTERRILVYQALPDEYRQGLSSDEAWVNSSAIYEQYKTEDAPFEILLIGLDGGVKLRKSELVERADLFGLIDQMPMRRAELRKQGE